MTVTPTRRPLPRPTAVTALAEHADAARTTRRRRRLRRTGSGLLLLLPVLGLAWVLLVSTWLAVDRVQVVGASRLSGAEVEAAAAVPPGTPLARVDGAAVIARVGALPAVADVEVSRSWPGTLRVQVTERVPVAGVVRGSGAALVDAGGVVLGAEPALPAGLVRLEVGDPGPDDPATRAALAVLAELPPALRQQVRVLRAPAAGAVVLVTDQDKQVVWGAVGGADTKAPAALALLGMDGTVVDVSAPGVAVRR